MATEAARTTSEGQDIPEGEAGVAIEDAAIVEAAEGEGEEEIGVEGLEEEVGEGHQERCAGAIGEVDEEIKLTF